jgi:hypothetical protein
MPVNRLSSKEEKQLSSNAAKMGSSSALDLGNLLFAAISANISVGASVGQVLSDVDEMSKIDVNDVLDVRREDTSRWEIVTVTNMSRNSKKQPFVQVQFDSGATEWINFNSERLSLFGQQTGKKHHRRFVGEYVEAQRMHPQPQGCAQPYIPAVVLEVTNTAVKVRYMNLGPEFDEWYDMQGDGQQRLTPGYFSTEKEKDFQARMHSLDFRIQEVEKDGNCMFRAISHQMYNDVDVHKIIRDRCCDYMTSKSERFKDYVDGDFASYLAEKRTESCWGDMPEIIACAEICERPVEIWSSELSESKPMHRFDISVRKNSDDDLRLSIDDAVNNSETIEVEPIRCCPCPNTKSLYLNPAAFDPLFFSRIYT